MDKIKMKITALVEKNKNLERELLDIQQNKKIIRKLDLQDSIELLREEIKFRIIADKRTFDEGVEKCIEILTSKVI